MPGRKAKLTVVNTKKPHMSNADLEKRHEREPSGCAADFEPPVELSPEALKEWNRVIALYKQLDVEVINDLDMMTLSAYCESAAIYKHAQREYQKSTLLVKEPVTGRAIENPYIKMMRREGVNIARYAEQLCLSPVGRARMGLAKEKKKLADDPMAAVLGDDWSD